MIKTFDLFLYFNGYTREYINISRTAARYYIEYHKENEDFYGYDLDTHYN